LPSNRSFLNILPGRFFAQRGAGLGPREYLALQQRDKMLTSAFEQGSG
jgi:hypothetical protein